jgi:hypothetical protein
MRPKQPIRWCAVYTRKSSEEGLEQDFNSLDAQCEAGRAYVQSQRHEGWRLDPTRLPLAEVVAAMRTPINAMVLRSSHLL